MKLLSPFAALLAAFVLISTPTVVMAAVPAAAPVFDCDGSDGDEEHVIGCDGDSSDGEDEMVVGCDGDGDDGESQYTLDEEQGDAESFTLEEDDDDGEEQLSLEEEDDSDEEE